MFLEFLQWKCKHYLGVNKDGQPVCKAFLGPEGIPKGHFCEKVTEYAVLDKEFIPPQLCANGLGFSFREGHKDPRVEAERLRKEGYSVPE